jgi:hypothetical protein
LVSFKIHLSTIKNTFLCFNIHTYTFQIYYSIFQKPYILLTYITIPFLYSNILPYTSIYIETVRTSLSCHYPIFQIVMAPHNSTKILCTCHDMFTRIQKSSIFHEFHKSYWFIKYLNPKLISLEGVIELWMPIWP